MSIEQYDTVVIGGGQAGLSVGYHLRARGLPFLILDANERTGDTWRRRWDSLRLFTPAAFSGLDGFPFPAPRDHFPSKDEFADYLDEYRSRFSLPVRHAARVTRLSRSENGYLVETAGSSGNSYRAKQVVVAMANYQRPSVPKFSSDLAPGIVQLHSCDYRNPSQLPAEGDVLVVGAGNSGAEIALELAREFSGARRVLLSGTYPGQLPFDIDSRPAHAVLIRLTLKGVFHRVLTRGTPIGRKAKPRLVRAGPLIRTKAKHLAAAGVEHVGRTVGVTRGRPLLEGGDAPDVTAVVWTSGYRPGFEWIDMPLEYDGNIPAQTRGAAKGFPGLYFVGLHFLYALSSAMIHGVGRDARVVARMIAA